MRWLENILRRLLGIEENETEKPTTKADSYVKKQESSTVRPTVRADSYKTHKQENNAAKPPAARDDNYKIKFESVDPMVEALLREMGQVKWGSDFRYEADASDLKWSIWKSDSVYLNVDYWSIKFIPTLAQLKIKCAGETIIESGLSRSELEEALEKAAKIGPVRMNVSSKIWH